MKLIWNRYGGLPECPYCRLWAVIWEKWSIRLHNWLGDDDHRHPHNHPYWFLTFILWGGYDDVSHLSDGTTVVDHVKAFSWRYRPADHMHQVLNVKRNTWTFLITGPATQRWGFRVGNKIIKRDKYFAVHGHHPCDGSDEGVRLKPGGERI